MSTQYDTLGASPIPGDRPAGHDVRDDPDFDRLQAEIDKLNNPTASLATDWDVVQRAATVLLAERGKDLLVACYLTGALMRRSGLTGLIDGLKVIDDLLAAHWDDMFPPRARMRARRNALQWLIERAQQYVSERVDRDTQQESVLIEALLTRLASIEAFLSDKDPDAPSVRTLASQIRTLPVRESEPEPSAQTPAPAPVAAGSVKSAGLPASAKTAAPTSSAGPAPVLALSTAPIVSLGDVDHAFEQISERLATLSGWLRNNDVSSAPAYRFNRMAAWGAIDSVPRAERGATKIPGPITELAIALDRLQSGDAPEDTLRFAEAQLPAFPYWLDLNRASAQALARLGESHASALAEVTSATAQLLRRAPELPNFTFADGKPFADGATLEWTSTLQRNTSSAGGGASSPDALAVALGTARALAAEGDLEAAAIALQRATASAAPEQRLRATMHLCELMLAHRPNAALRPFANLLVAEIDRHALDRWAPALALEALSAAHAVIAQAGLHEEASRLLERIARIDAATAVRLITSG
jgi:type VI secretion system protein VasJ